MAEEPAFPEPRRVLQIYNADAQKAFCRWSAKDKLEWLEAINKLYWAGVMSPNQKKPPKNS